MHHKQAGSIRRGRYCHGDYHGLFLISYSPSAQAAPQAKPQSALQIDVFITGMGPTEAVKAIKAAVRPDGTFQIDSFFDIEYSHVVWNIGSSGTDGTTLVGGQISGDDGMHASSFIVDSFFDVEYVITYQAKTGSWDTEMLSMSLRAPVPDLSPRRWNRHLRWLRRR